MSEPTDKELISDARRESAVVARGDAARIDCEVVSDTIEALCDRLEAKGKYGATCAYCEWRLHGIDSFEIAKRLTQEHAASCRSHPMRAVERALSEATARAERAEVERDKLWAACEAVVRLVIRDLDPSNLRAELVRRLEAALAPAAEGTR